jgi:hypothetical protein
MQIALSALVWYLVVFAFVLVAMGLMTTAPLKV